MRRVALIAATTGLLALAGGCGSSGPPVGTSRSVGGVRAVISRFGADLIDKRFSDACALMTSGAQAAIVKSAQSVLKGAGPSGCAAVLALAVEFAGAQRVRSQVTKAEGATVKISGDRATVANGQGGTTVLIYTRGRWLIDNPGVGG